MINDNSTIKIEEFYIHMYVLQSESYKIKVDKLKNYIW